MTLQPEARSAKREGEAALKPNPEPAKSVLPLAEQLIGERFEALGGQQALGEIQEKGPDVWHFKNGSCLCFNEDVRSVFYVYGGIYARWRELGGVSSYLGRPTSDEVDFVNSGRANSFENGAIYWWPETGSIDLADVVIRFRGIHCFGETDRDQTSGADEPYVIMAVIAPHAGHTTRSPIYESVDAGYSRSALIDIYRGPPWGLSIGTVVMESDFGDPDSYQKKLQDLVTEAHNIGVVALQHIPLVGPSVAKIVDEVMKNYLDEVAEAIGDALDLKDDEIGRCTVSLDAKQMVMLAARPPHHTHFKQLDFMFESPLVSGHGASYKVYFDIVRA